MYLITLGCMFEIDLKVYFVIYILQDAIKDFLIKIPSSWEKKIKKQKECQKDGNFFK